MSGGSMDYLSYKVQDASFALTTPERKAFRAHLQKVAEALHKIEWNDSGDGADGESESIQACLSAGAVMDQVIADAEKALMLLATEIDRAKGATK